MATDPISNPPPGFEDLTREEQLEYIQKLWDHMAADATTVPVPDWHLDIVKDRAESHEPSNAKDWGDLETRLTEKYGG
jgi:hypothetical protein